MLHSHDDTAHPAHELSSLRFAVSPGPSSDTIESTAAVAGPSHIPHHPQLPGYVPGFGVPVPGGDCRRLCVRHQRMVDGGAAMRLQKSIENLSPADQTAANTVWSLFSSSTGAQRALILRGILSICCPSQLSFLSEQIKAECRIDPFSLFPNEVSLRCLSSLDAISLGRAAQVSRTWRVLADNDILWRTMCQQHIERKCEKCGWGLPLLEKKRRVRAAAAASRQQPPVQRPLAHDQPDAGPSPLGSPGGPVPTTSGDVATAYAAEHHHGADSPPPASSPSSSSSKRARPEDIEALAAMDLDTPPTVRSRPSSRMAQHRPQMASHTKPWKRVYTERLVVERNWRKGSCGVKVFEGHTDAITCLQFDETLSSPSFPVLMTGSWDRSVRIWNMETGACINELRGHQRGVRALQFDSDKLITGSMDATLKIWSWRTGECVRTLTGHRDSVICLTYDDHLLASGSADSTIKLWDFSTGECVTFRGHREWVNSLQIWSPDECDEPVATDLALTGPATTSSSTTASGTSLPPKLKLLFSSSDDGTIRVWDLATRQCVRILQGHVAQVQSLRVISVPGGGIVPTMPTAVLGKSLALNRIGSQTAGGGGDYFSAAEDGSCSVSPGHRLASDPDETASDAGEAELVPLDFGTGNQPLLISAGLDNTIKMWNIEQGRCDRTLFGHVEGVWAVDADKLRLVSGSHDRTIKVWDRSTGRCMHTLVGHRGAVTAVTLSDDKIVSGGDDGSCRMWSFASTI